DAAQILRIYRPADWRQRHGAHGRMRLKGDRQQWRILEGIAERGIAQAETAADLHPRAQPELDAVDDALMGLLGQPSTARAPSQQPAGLALPAPAPAPRAA